MNKYKYIQLSNNSNEFIADPNIIKNYKQISHQEFKDKYKINVDEIIGNVNPNSNICIEGGHIYVNESLSLDHIKQLDITANLKKYLQDVGFNIQSLLFVDDFHPSKSENVFDLNKYKEIAKDFGLVFDMVISEKAMLPLAHKMINDLYEQGLVLEKQGNLLLKGGKKPMLKKHDNNPTCAMLDSAFTKLKLDNFDLIINVLDNSYKKQQAYTKKITETTLNKKIEMHTLLTN